MFVRKPFTQCSASQLKTYNPENGCKRKWYLNKIVGWDIPMTFANKVGVELHSQMEQYFKTGKLPELKLAQEGIEAKHYPLPNPRLLVEATINLTSVVPILGYSDLIDPEPGNVFDHKTTSAWRWVKSPEELRADPQCTVYLRWVFEQNPKLMKASFRHVYFNTKEKAAVGDRTRSVGVTVTREENQAEWVRVEAQLREMQKTAELESPVDVEPNYEHCEAYGGCPFRLFCAKHSGGTMGLFSKILTNVAKDSLAAPAPQPAADDGVNPPDAPIIPVATSTPAITLSSGENAEPSSPAPEPKKRGRPAKVQNDDADVVDLAKEIFIRRIARYEDNLFYKQDGGANFVGEAQYSMKAAEAFMTAKKAREV